ncbi:MAG: IS110 family transposase [Candidatus Sulfotelmatobacter sp.]
MHFIGVDLHKQVISVCVLVRAGDERRIVARRTLRCDQPPQIQEYFAELSPFQVVVEATSSYEWFVQLLEPLAERIVLAHPKKLRIIAESTKKTDRLDAQVLAEFLALDMIPAAHRPSPRLREYRALVRQRQYVQRRITSLKNRLRHLLSHYNADVKHLFSREGQVYLDALALSAADRFVVEQLREGWRFFDGQLKAMDERLRQFAKSASVAEHEARQVLETIPCVGPVTVDIVLSELGDVRRFRSQKQAAAYAGLAPGIRQSAGRGKQLGITKQGSGLLRWALIETAWRVVGKTRRWGLIYEKLKQRTGAKKAIVAVARRVLGVMVALLRTGRRYSLASEAQV